jgi:hypothetical protein
MTLILKAEKGGYKGHNMVINFKGMSVYAEV